MVLPILRQHRQAALEELDKLLQDRKDFPINYNHYYTDTIHKKRQERFQSQLEKHMDVGGQIGMGQAFEVPDGKVYHDSVHFPTVISETVSNWSKSVTPDMEKFSCEEALDSLLAIYKVGNKLRSNT